MHKSWCWYRLIVSLLWPKKGSAEFKTKKKEEANKGVQKTECAGRVTRLLERGALVCFTMTHGQPLMSLGPEPGSPLPNSHPKCGCSLCWSSVKLLVLPYPLLAPPSTPLSATHWDITIWWGWLALVRTTVGVRQGVLRCSRLPFASTELSDPFVIAWNSHAVAEETGVRSQGQLGSTPLVVLAGQ